MLYRFLFFLFVQLSLLFRLFFLLLLFPVDFLELWSMHDVSEVSLPYDPAFLHHDDLIYCLCELDRMCGHNDGFVFEVAQESLSHQKLADMHIHCAEYVIEEVDLSVGVECAGQADPGFLAA